MGIVSPPGRNGKAHPDRADLERRFGLLRRRFFSAPGVVAVNAPRADGSRTAWPCEADAETLDHLLSAHLGIADALEVRVRPTEDMREKGITQGPRKRVNRVGRYLPDRDGLTPLAVLDIDGGAGHSRPVEDPEGLARKAARLALELGLNPSVERSRSGEGYHVWLFFAGPVPAPKVLALLLRLREELDPRVEFRPTCARLDEGGTGTQTWAPWWCEAAEGNNEFVRFMPERGTEAYQPEDFRTSTEADLDYALRKLGIDPDDPLPEKPRVKADRTAAHEHWTPLRLLEWVRDRWVNGRYRVSALGHSFREEYEGRNSACFDLACQFRDCGYEQEEAEEHVLDFFEEIKDSGEKDLKESHIRATVRSAYRGRMRDPLPVPGGKGGGADLPAGLLTNFVEQEGDEGEVVRIGLGLPEITSRLSDLTGGWPKRVGGRLFVPAPGPPCWGDSPRWTDSADALFAWCGARLADGTGNPVRWTHGTDKVGRGEFLAHLQNSVERFDQVELFPHHPPMPRTYYLHPQTAGGDGRALRALLGRFSPSTDHDHDLLEALVLTFLWGGPLGARPAFLIESEDDDGKGGRGVGKTTAAEVMAELVGGAVAAKGKDDLDKLKTRLLSAGGLAKRVGLLDNVKALKFSSAELESLITARHVSGHALYAGEAKRPNTLTWLLTINGASLSRDLAQRVIPVRLKRPEYDPKWKADTLRLIEEARAAIIGDALAKLAGGGERLESYSRWADWEDGVLSRVADPGSAQKLIAERQADIDSDDDEADAIREAFAAALRENKYDPDTAAVFFTCKDAAQIVNGAEGTSRTSTGTTAYLKTLTIRELRRGKSDAKRGWVWRGSKASPSVSAVAFQRSVFSQ
jgi:hypothetical protein